MRRRRAFKPTVYLPRGRDGKPTRNHWGKYKLPGDMRPRRESLGTSDEQEAWRLLYERCGEDPAVRTERETREAISVRRLLRLARDHYADHGRTVPSGAYELFDDALGDLRAAEIFEPMLDDLCRTLRNRGATWRLRDAAGNILRDAAGRPRSRDPKRVVPLDGATCNRYLSFLCRAYSLGRRKLGLVSALTFPHFRETARGKRIPAAALARLLSTITTPALLDMTRLAADLGPRQGQWRGLQKRNVVLDEHGTVVALDWTPDQTKAELKHTIAIAPGESQAILQRLWDTRRAGCAYLFHGTRRCTQRAPEDRPCVGKLQSEWEGACRRAGFPIGRKQGGYTFKDTRNTFVSDMVDAGQDAAVIACFTGWKNLAMLKRYTTVAVRTQHEAIAHKNAVRTAQPPAPRRLHLMRRRGAQ